MKKKEKSTEYLKQLKCVFYMLLEVFMESCGHLTATTDGPQPELAYGTTRKCAERLN